MSPEAQAGGPAIGSEFAGHRVEAVIGRGGMGVVYRARNLALDRLRALKVLAPALSGDARFRERFRRESRLAASIEHPNVIPVHQAGEEDGHLFLSMRLVEGRDLREIVSAEGPPEPRRAAEIIRGAAAGLDAAHRAGLTHRDVKPANVLVGDGADAGRVYLTDFGISRTIGGGETLTGTGELVGTADFISPEQIAGGEVGHRADVYALGAVLHFALTGRAPFPRENELATLFAHANAPRPRPTEARTDLPAGIDAVIERAMAIDPSERYASGAELADAVDAALGGRGVAPAPPPADHEAPTRRLARQRRSRRWLLAGVAVAVLAVAVAAALLASGDDPGERVSAPKATASGPIEVGDAPVSLSVGPSRLWVSARGDNRVDGLSLDDGQIEFSVDVPSPSAVAVGHDSIWAVTNETDALFRIDALEGRTARVELPPGTHPADVTTYDDWVWVASGGRQSVLRIDPDRNQVDGEVQLGTPPRALAAGEGSVWVTNFAAASVARIDPDAARLDGSAIAVSESPNDIAVGEGGVWVTSFLNGTVTRIDPEEETAGDPIAVGGRPRGIAAGLGYVWVAVASEDAVVRIDPGAGRLAGDPIPVGKEPADIAIAPNDVWVANAAESTVTRITP